MALGQNSDNDTKQRLRQLLFEISGIDKDYDDPVQYAQTIRDFYENVLTSLPYNVYWKDNNLTYRGCNQQMASSVGLTSESIKGCRDRDLVWANEAFVINQIDQEVLNTQRHLQVEETVHLHDGKKHTYLSNKLPLYSHDPDSDEVIGLVGISLSIEPLKRLEKTLQQTKHELKLANKAKNILTSKITHDLRNPLSSILMMARHMHEGQCNEHEKSQYISAIMTCSQQLLDLLRNLLESGKQGSQVLTINANPFNLKSLLSQIENELAIRAQQDQTQYTVHFDDNIPQRLMGDAMQLRRVLYNLSDNALKFTKQGYVDVYVDLLNWPTDNEVNLQFQVKDNGLGIPKNKLKSVFSDYEQLTSQEHINSTAKWGGVGLGLAIVQELVHAMGGEVHVDSEVGCGTNFWFTLTFKQAPWGPNDMLDEDDETSHYIHQFQRKPRILVVDDEAISRRAISHLCENQNCHVDTAANQDGALEQLQHNNYDIVFMDMFLGDQQGSELVQYYHSTRQSDQDAPVFYALTANSNTHDQKAYLDAGMDDVLLKPLTSDKLKSLLKKIK